MSGFRVQAIGFRVLSPRYGSDEGIWDLKTLIFRYLDPQTHLSLHFLICAICPFKAP